MVETTQTKVTFTNGTAVNCVMCESIVDVEKCRAFEDYHICNECITYEEE